MLELNRQFEKEPRWSKETLKVISRDTKLTEGQVYKWGWDKKRKEFGTQMAEQMRQEEHKMDQENQNRRQQHLQQSHVVSVIDVDLPDSNH